MDQRRVTLRAPTPAFPKGTAAIGAGSRRRPRCPKPWRFRYEYGTGRTFGVIEGYGLQAILAHAPLPTPAAEPSLMGMPDTAGRETRDARRWTRDAVLALPDDGRRYELIDGQLVVTSAPSGGHQVAVTTLLLRIGPVLKQAADTSARILVSPADISLGEEEILQPDLFIYLAETGRQLTEWSDISSLLVAIEILSPSTARYDRGLKRLRYQRALVPEYWIVDLDGRLVERWRPDDTRPEVLRERLLWASGDGAEVDLDLREFFREVAGT